MLTELTSDLGFWIIVATIFISVGTYKLLTKQNADANTQNRQQIKEVGEKIDNFRTDTKIEQAELKSNISHINDKINRIESDTAITRSQSNTFSDTIARIQVKIEGLEKSVEKIKND